MVRWGMLGVALGLAGLASNASADTKTLARAGRWEAIGGIANDGLAMCGISGWQGPNAFLLKLFTQQDAFTITLGNEQWRAAAGDGVSFSLRFDEAKPWRGSAGVVAVKNERISLQAVIKRAQVGRFINEFRTSRTLHIEFEGDRFPAVTMALDGVQEVSEAFERCMRSLAAS